MNMNKPYGLSLTRNRHLAFDIWLNWPSSLFVLMITLTSFFTQAQAFVIGHVEHQEAQATPNDSALSPDGKYLYTVADNSSDNNAIVEVFSRDEQSGELTATSVVSGALADGITLASGGGIAISPDGLAAYVVGSVGDGSEFNFVDLAIFWFGRDIDSGTLTYLGHIKAGDTPANFGSTFTGPFIISNDGKHLYAGTVGGHASIEHYNIGNDRSLTWDESLTQGVNNEDFRGGHLRVYQDKDSKHVYATGLEHLGGMIYVFSRNAESGKLTITQQLSAKEDSLPDIENPRGLAISQDGKFVYVTTIRAKDRSTFSEDEGVISIFDRDSASGALAYKNSATNKPVPHPSNGSDYNSLFLHNAVVLSQDSEQRFLYSNGSYGALNVFRRQLDGTLEWLGWRFEGDEASHPRTASHKNLLVSSDSRFVYLLGRGSGTVAVYDTSADLAIVKTDGVDPVAPSGAFNYTLATTNNGPSDALNVIVTDPLPTGVTYISGSVNAADASCSESGGTVICSMGNIAHTGATTATIEVTAPATTGTLTNTASVSADQLDTEKVNNTDSEDTGVAIDGGSGGGSSTASEEGGNGDSSDSSSSGGGGSFGSVLLITLCVSNLLRRKRLVKYL